MAGKKGSKHCPVEVKQVETACLAVSTCFQQSADLERDDPQEFQNDEDDGNNDQNMDPAACFRKAWAYVSAEKSEQPQDD